MKMPPFTLVHDRSTDSRRQLQDLLNARIHAIEAAEPTLAASLKKQSQGFTKTLLATSLGTTGSHADSVTDAIPNLRRVVEELERQPNVITVGIWDLGARVSRLPRMIEVLNAAQGLFAIFEVEAAIPAGMISRPERVVAWLHEQTGKAPNRKERSEIENNMIAEDFYRRGNIVRKDLGLDYLVGITPSMVAFEDEGGVYWNNFATYDKRLVLASTHDLRMFAEKAGRPFEVAVGGLICGMLLVAVNPRLEYHEKNTGCLFDMNLDRKSIVKTIKNANIDERCMSLMQPKFRPVATALLEALRNYQGEDSP
ncbi:MAG TPA: hypothetical protein VKP13_18765 [Nitrospira sp.]|nr:hypothetical protein [Nitrospira sp.]